tara:strand:+ start:3086 stop:3994 length:909 start_codon:yes stop_codon:yes gene_type:complete
MITGIFLNSANDNKFRKMLFDFQWGIAELGDEAFVTTNDDDIDECDVAVIFGSWKDRDTPWHNCKRSIVESGKPFICVETPLIGRGPVSNILQDEWYRIGVNGFLADTGRFFRQSQSYPSDRWEKISKNLNVKLLPWKKEGNYIVIALQLPGDASLRGINVTKWAADTAEELRMYTDRPIVVRTPQLDRQFDKENIVRITRIEGAALQQGTKDNLLETLDAAYATVTYSSGFGIDSVIRGTPTIAMDPGSFAYSLGNNKLSQIEDLVRSNDRQQWLNNLSYAQWSRKEIKDGRAWQHIRNQL